jgi:hypothetical protein
MPEPRAVPEADAIRTEMSQVHVGSPRHTELAAQLEHAYRQAHGPSSSESSTATTASPVPREDAAARLAAIPDPRSPEAVAASAFPTFTPPPGHALDVDALVELRGMELSHDVPVAELTVMANEYTQAQARQGQDAEARRDARDAQLLEAWGDNYELELTRATEMAQRIPKRVLDHALQAGMHYDPVLWLKLAELWTRTHGR